MRSTGTRSMTISRGSRLGRTEGGPLRSQQVLKLLKRRPFDPPDGMFGGPA